MSFQMMELPLSDQGLEDAALRSFGKHIRKNYYGVPVDMSDPMRSPVRGLRDWNANGLAGLVKDFQAKVKKEGGGREGIVKTLTAGSATVGNFTPVVITPGVMDTARRKFPFLTSISKNPAMGATVNINKRTTRQQLVFGAGDGATLSDQDQASTKVTANQAYMYMAGGVAGPAQKISELTIDLYLFEVQKHMLDFLFRKEELFFRADENAGSTLASVIDISAESTKFTGILPALEDAGATYYTDLAGARRITVSDIMSHHEKIEDRGGEVGATFMDRNTYTYVRKQASAHGVIDFDVPKFGFGLREFNIEGIPCIWSPGLLSTAGQRAAVSLDYRAFGEFPLLDIEHVPVAQQKSDKREFFDRNYSTVKLVAHEWAQATVDGK